MLHGTLAELGSADGEQREQLAQTVSRLFLRGKALASLFDALRPCR